MNNLPFAPEGDHIVPSGETILKKLDIDPTVLKFIKPRSKRAQYRAIIDWLTKYQPPTKKPLSSAWIIEKAPLNLFCSPKFRSQITSPFSRNLITLAYRVLSPAYSPPISRSPLDAWVIVLALLHSVPLKIQASVTIFCPSPQ